MFRSLLSLAAIVAMVTLSGAHAAPPPGVKAGERAKVAAVIDGDTATLDRRVEGAIEVRLVGLQAPKLPLGRVGFPTWPLADEARAAVADMLAIEAAARGARRGIWAHPFYALLTPEQANGRIDTFQIVEGRVVGTARVGGRTYLNFGTDWRTDFTVSMAAAADRLFRRQGLDLLTLEGRRVRVRGWLGRYNGPTVEATHPEQLELLDLP